MIFVAVLFGLASTAVAAVGGGQSLGLALISSVLLMIGLGMAYSAGRSRGVDDGV